MADAAGGGSRKWAKTKYALRFLLGVLLGYLLFGSGIFGNWWKKFPRGRETFVLVDNRTPEEYAAGHLPGARNLPYDGIADTIGAAAPRKNTRIKLYCRSGRRSGIAKETLEKLGYTAVENLGGMDAAGEILGLTPVSGER